MVIRLPRQGVWRTIRNAQHAAEPQPPLCRTKNCNKQEDHKTGTERVFYQDEKEDVIQRIYIGTYIGYDIRTYRMRGHFV